MAEEYNPGSISDEEVEDWEIELDQYLIFSVDERFFGFQAMRIMEISAVVPTTEVPDAPGYIEGIMNLRGKLASVINFRKKFGFKSHPHDEDTRTIIVEQEGYPVGIIVDSVEEVMKLPDQMLQPLPKEAESFKSEKYISKIGMIDDRFIIILDVDSVLEHVKLEEVESFKNTLEKISDLDVDQINANVTTEIDENVPAEIDKNVTTEIDENIPAEKPGEETKNEDEKKESE